MVLSGFGQFPTEKRIRQILGNPLSGLSRAQAYHQIVGYSVDVAFHHADWGLIDLRDCLREGWHPIVGVERRFLGHPDALHAVVLIEINSQAVQALDPLGSSIPENISPETFERAWISAGHQALIIKSPFTL